MKVATFPSEVPTWEVYHRDSIGSLLHVCAVGDIGFSGRVGLSIVQKFGTNKFQEIAPFLESADITLGNLETPLLSSWTHTKMFAGDVQSGGLLSKAGFTHIHLANNHIYDYGPGGLATTLQICKTHGLTPLGAGVTRSEVKNPICDNKKGIKIGWLACGRTLKQQAQNPPFYWEYDEKELIERVIKLRPSVDFIILSLHLGLMYLDYPTPEHKRNAENLVEAGADLILMHHAHVLQGVQKYRNGIICYNMGNFLFDWEEGNVRSDVVVEQQRQGGIFSFELDKKGICNFFVLPTYIDDDLNVRWARGMLGQDILDRLKRISEGLETNYFPIFRKQRMERNIYQATKVLWFHLQQRNWGVLKDYIKIIRWRHFMVGLDFLGSKVRNALFS